MDASTNNDIQLYNAIQWQNDILQSSYNKMYDLYSVDNEKVKYLLDNMNWYVYVNYYFWYLYYIVCLAVLYCVFYGKDRGFSIYVKLLIFIAFLVYPLIIASIETGIYNWLNYVYMVFRGSLYQPSTNHQSAITYYNSIPFWSN
jgi:hypothetical protein